MNDRYMCVNVEIPLDVESELYERLQKSAELDGMTIEDLVKWLLMVGSSHILSERLEKWDREREVLPEQVGQK